MENIHVTKYVLKFTKNKGLLEILLECVKNLDIV